MSAAEAARREHSGVQLKAIGTPLGLRVDQEAHMPSPTNYTMHATDTSHIRKMILDVAMNAREGIEQVSDPRAKALFETTAEVLDGLAKAYQDYDEGTEVAWRR
jgi:hypothetical protein